MLRLKRIVFMSERKLLIITLIACFLSIFVAANANADMYWKDYNGEGAGGYMPDIDQNQDFDKTQARTEQTDPNVVCGQNWILYPDTQASGGSITYSDTTDDSCTFSFTGTSIRYIGTPSNNKGIASVHVDQDPPVDVNLYSSTLKYHQVLYTKENLSPGQHTITIVVTGRKDDHSSLPRIDVDAFDVDDIELEYCAPVAEANSLWWLDKKYDLGLFDTQTHTVYATDINHDGSKDIMDLVQELAQLMGTNGGQTGTTVPLEIFGTYSFLNNHHLLDRLELHDVFGVDFPGWLDFFHYLEEQVELSQDVKLDLGFYRILDCDEQDMLIQWQRVGGHAVTVAGVDSQNLLFAISDPDNDAAEAPQGIGVVRTPVGHQHPSYPHDSDVHNNEEYASHDIYTVAVGPSPSPGGTMGLLRNYPPKTNLPPEAPVWVPWPNDFTECIPQVILTEIEAAVIVSPLWPDISVDPTILDFKLVLVKGSSNKTVTVSNAGTPGTGTLNIGAITITGTNASQFSQTNNCSTPVAPGGSCTITVKFSPTSAGAKSATLRIPSNDPDENPLDVSLTGQGAKIVVQYPNGGETLQSGRGYKVTWETSSVVGPVAKTVLKYTVDGGTTWKSMAPPLIGNFGSHIWEVPVMATSKRCKVKVILQNASGSTLGSDVSDRNFTIQFVPIR